MSMNTLLQKNDRLVVQSGKILLMSSLCMTITSGVFGGGSSWANDRVIDKWHGHGAMACSKTAVAAKTACSNESKDDYWITVGNCKNLSDHYLVNTCLREAKIALKESNSLCRDQYAARLEICATMGEDPYDPLIDPDYFVDFGAASGSGTILSNLYYPLIAGTTQNYHVFDTEGNLVEKIKVEVLNEIKEILGINSIVVRDRVWEVDEDGTETLIEDTDDWYGQDIEGNVWYLGEIAQNFEDGELVDVEGSWKTGRGHDKPGYMMLAQPEPEYMYRQEFSLGNAEDMAVVIGIVDEVEAGGISYTKVLQTKEFSPVEPDVYAYKYYAEGVGCVREESYEDEELVEIVELVELILP